jgi:hypothetical protein
MCPTSELRRILGQTFDWNKARLDCFAGMLLALIKVRTVNLREIAVAFDSNALVDSRYKRLKRFFAGFKIDSDVLAKCIFNLFFRNTKKVYLTVDRTNWFFGKAKINILTLGVCYEGVAIPLFWMLLPKAGNATGKEHAAIVKRFVEVFGKDKIQAVLADREFSNQDFFKWLVAENIHFCIRVKEGAMVRMFTEKKWKVGKLFRDLKLRSQKTCMQPIYIHGQKLYVAAGRSDTGELLVVVTNSIKMYQRATSVSIYLRRWEIETLFQSLKGRGFRFEETHITKLDRISRLMALLSIAFCWMHKIGEWRAIKKPIVLNKHRDSRRPQYSYFRYGLDFIREIMLCFSNKTKQLKLCLKQLIPPKIKNVEGAS